jgi:uncharacterized repeat protein (TIGR01451 family)
VTTPSLPRLAARTCAALALSAALAAPAVAGEPATLRLEASSPSYGSLVGVPLLGGGSSPLVPGRNEYTVTRAGGAAATTGFGIDPLSVLPLGVDYPVDLQTAFDDPAMSAGPYREAGWLLYRSGDLIASAGDPRLEAGALHLAILQLTGQTPPALGAIGHPALVARTDALRDLAAGRRLPTSVALDAGGPDACPGQDLTVRVTGSSGALVDLSVPAGSGTVSPARVSLSGAGAAEAHVRASAPGILTVSAAMSAPSLQRATRLPGWIVPQSQLLLRPGLLTVLAQRRVVECRLELFDPPAPETPEESPKQPSKPPAPSPKTPPPGSPKLGMRVDAPGAARAGGRLTWRIVVTNRGPKPARDVRVAQRLGAGVAALGATGPRGTAWTARGASVRWVLPAIPAHSAAVLVLRARVSPRASGIRTTTATLRVGGLAAVRSADAIAVRPAVPAVE